MQNFCQLSLCWQLSFANISCIRRLVISIVCYCTHSLSTVVLLEPATTFYTFTVDVSECSRVQREEYGDVDVAIVRLLC